MYQVTNNYYGEYGGAFIPELLRPAVLELEKAFREACHDEVFQKAFKDLLQDYVGRPTPLTLATRLSEYYGYRVYLKREDLCHTGAHKINNTVGQILLAHRMGKHRIIAETGAGQHGVATATACALLGLECTVYMGEKDISRQAPNVARMKMLGANVVPARSGSRTLKDATNEAIRAWINDPSAYYLIGSVVGPAPYPEMVELFQSVISQEIKSQLKELPTAVIACVGGGSNAAGAFHHFLDMDVQLIGVEAAGHGVNTGLTAATLQLGSPGVLHGSLSYMMQTTDGQVVEPHSISAGLDYPGVGPLHAHLKDTGRASYMPITDEQSVKAAQLLCKLEGIIPALESAHALAVLDELSFDSDSAVVVNLSGRGDKDMGTYMQMMSHGE